LEHFLNHSYESVSLWTWPPFYIHY
jgi:hypothetical protein